MSKMRSQSPIKVMNQKMIPTNMHENTRKILADAGVDDDVIIGQSEEGESSMLETVPNFHKFPQSTITN